MSSAGRDGTHPSRPFCFARVSPFERPDDVPPRVRRTGRIGHKTCGTNRLAGTMKQGIHSMATTAFPTRDDFAAMLDESLGGADGGFEGRVVKGTVTAIENDLAVIDIGLKSEGRVQIGRASCRERGGQDV